MRVHNGYDFPTIYEELKPFANMVVYGTAGREVTVGDMEYVTHKTLYSTSLLSLGASANISAGAKLDFFQTGENEQGQGWVGALTKSQTNFVGSQGQYPANQAFVATRCGFSVFLLDADDTTGVGNNYYNVGYPDDLLGIIQKGVWSLTTGRGPKREIGALVDYPAGYGVAAVGGGAFANAAQTENIPGGCQNGIPGVPLKPLDIPIIFPPLVNVEMDVKWGSSFALTNSGTAPYNLNNLYLAVRCNLYGFEFTKPV